MSIIAFRATQDNHETSESRAKCRDIGSSTTPTRTTRTWRPAFDDEIADATLSDSEFRLVLAIRRCLYHTENPSNADLVEATGWSVRKVQRTLRSLEAKGRGDRDLRPDRGRIVRHGITLPGDPLKDGPESGTSKMTGVRKTNTSNLSPTPDNFDAIGMSKMTCNKRDKGKETKETTTPAVVVVVEVDGSSGDRLDAPDSDSPPPAVPPALPSWAYVPAANDPPDMADLIAAVEDAMGLDPAPAATLLRSELKKGRPVEVIRAAIERTGDAQAAAIESSFSGGEVNPGGLRDVRAFFRKVCENKHKEHIEAERARQTSDRFVVPRRRPAPGTPEAEEARRKADGARAELARQLARFAPCQRGATR